MYENNSDEQIFADVYKKYFPIIFRVVYTIVYNREACEEICQEAFIKYHQRVNTIPEEVAKYWLIRVGKNLAINYAKRKEREYRAYNKILYQPKQTERSADTDVVRREIAGEVIHAITQLPVRLREALILKTYGDLNYKEVARVLGISDSNVKVRVYRARMKLADILRKRGISDNA